MRVIVKAGFTGAYQVNFQHLEGVLFTTPTGALQGLCREKEGCKEAVEEMVAHLPDSAQTLELPPNLGAKAATLTQQLEQVRDLKAWAADLLRAATSTEVLLEDRREAIIKKVVTSVRTTAHREDLGLLALFEKTLRYYGQVGKQAAKKRAENAAAAASSAAAAPSASRPQGRGAGGGQGVSSPALKELGIMAMTRIHEGKRQPGSPLGPHRAEGPASPARKASSELGPGEALEPSVRAQMERGLGEDLSAVRVHRDAHAARLADAEGAPAFTVGQHVAFGSGQYAPQTIPGQLMLAHELAHALQQRGGEGPGAGASELAEREADLAAIGVLAGRPQRVTRGGGLRLQRCNGKRQEQARPQQASGERLAGQFARDFPDAAALVRGNASAMRLLGEAETGGAAYGGFAEDGPGRTAWPYTIGNTVYVPRAHRADAQTAMSDFVFELTNAISRSRHAEVERRGAAGAINAEQYAHDTVGIELDGAMRTAEIWAAQRDSVTDPAQRARLDAENYYAEYQDVRAGRRTREDIIQNMLNRTYPGGTQTVRQFYVDQYNSMRGTAGGSTP